MEQPQPWQPQGHSSAFASLGQHGSNGCAYFFHLFKRKPISPSKIAWGARRDNVIFCVPSVVVNSIQTAIILRRATMKARLLNKFRQFVCAKIAAVYTLIRFSEVHRTAFNRFVVSLLSRSNFKFLSISQICPSVCSVVAASFSFSVTRLALISQSVFSSFVFKKELGCGQKLLVAPIAYLMPFQRRLAVTLGFIRHVSPPWLLPPHSMPASIERKAVT
jgi:hypothetical protein